MSLGDKVFACGVIVGFLFACMIALVRIGVRLIAEVNR